MTNEKQPEQQRRDDIAEVVKRYTAKEDDQHHTHSWHAPDFSANVIRTEYDPQFFTPHMARLRMLGLALADPKRLLILSLLAEEDRPMYGQEIAEYLGVTPQTISHHLHILENGGLIRERREKAFRYYFLDTESICRLREIAFSDDHLGFPTKTDARNQVIDIFFKDGRLVSIPSQPTKRRIILEELARSFEWGKIYSEAEVNAVLKSFHDDVSSLRRYLVDEHIMMRERDRYWLVRPNEIS